MTFQQRFVRLSGVCEAMAGAALIGGSPATKVGKYVVSKLLGAGSFAQVYHAAHEETGQEVALKAIRAASLTPKAVKNLELEIGILRKLRHPHIVSLLDVMVRAVQRYSGCVFHSSHLPGRRSLTTTCF